MAEDYRNMVVRIHRETRAGFLMHDYAVRPARMPEQRATNREAG